jgi:hypothetical protein
MINYYLVNQTPNYKPDNLEKIGNFLLTPLRFVCGRTIKIDQDGKITELPQAHKVKRIAVAIFSSAFFMITIPTLAIGIICLLNSKSYKQSKEIYLASRNQAQILPPPIVPETDESLIVDQPLQEEIEPPTPAPADNANQPIPNPPVPGNTDVPSCEDSNECEDPNENEEVPQLSEVNPKSYPSWRKAGALASLVLIGIPLAYSAYTNSSLVMDKVNQLFAQIMSKETFDTVIGPFAENVGLPLIRSGCYVSAMALGVKKVAQGVAALGLKCIPGQTALEIKVNNAFKNHLARDVCLIIGLLGTGLLVEDLESDLNIYLQQLEISKRPLTHLLNGDFTEFYHRIREAFYGADQLVVNASANEAQKITSSMLPMGGEYLTRLQPLVNAALHSMKRFRITPLSSHAILELKFGLPLRRLGITQDPDMSPITKFFTDLDLNKIAMDVKDCLTIDCLNEKTASLVRTVNSLYEKSVHFLASPIENTKNYAADYTSGILKRTMAWRLYDMLGKIGVV